MFLIIIDYPVIYLNVTIVKFNFNLLEHLLEKLHHSS